MSGPDSPLSGQGMFSTPRRRSRARLLRGGRPRPARTLPRSRSPLGGRGGERGRGWVAVVAGGAQIRMAGGGGGASGGCGFPIVQ